VQNDKDDSNDDQDMDPTANFRETWADPPAEETKQPQDYQNNDDDPQQRHGISPNK
jgi:hypothetical protein